MLAALTLAAAVALGTPVVDPATIAQVEFAAIAHGTIDRSHYTQRMSAQLDDATLADLSAALTPLGSLKRMGLNSSRQIDGDNVYAYVMVCAGGNVLMQIAIDSNHLVDGVIFRPWGGSASYAANGVASWGSTYDVGPMTSAPSQPATSQ